MTSAPKAPIPATSDGVAQPPYIATMMMMMSSRNGRKRGRLSNPVPPGEALVDEQRVRRRAPLPASAAAAFRGT